MVKTRQYWLYNNRALKFLLCIIIVVASLVVARTIYEQHIVSEMKAIKEEFSPPASWSSYYDVATPPYLLCIDMVCPSYSHGWHPTSPMSRSDFDKLVLPKTWKLLSTSQCSPRSDGSLSICKKEFSRGSYRINLRYDGISSVAGQDLTLEISR